MTYKTDWLLIFSVLGLLTFSLFFVYSSSVDLQGQLQSTEFIRQFSFVIIGIIFFIIISLVKYNYIENSAWYIYVFFILLLIITFMFGSVRNGARSWLGFWGFGIQASEFSKVALMVAMAAFVKKRGQNFLMVRDTITLALLTLLPMGLILLQPDMGTSLVFIPILLFVLYIAGMNEKKVFFVVGVGVVAVIILIVSYWLLDFSSSVEQKMSLMLRSQAFLLYLLGVFALCILALLGRLVVYMKAFFNTLAYISAMVLFGNTFAYIATYVLKPYQLQRLLVFVNPESDSLGSGWQILQSVSAIGSGGMLGQGFLQGKQSNFQFLPQKSTDFIFSLIGEEIGFIGSVSIILLYGLLLFRIVFIGMNSKDIFSRVFCAGAIAMFFTHFVVSIGMTLGVMPITGIPLLLVSYGGSSVLSSLIAIGIVHNIYISESYKHQESRNISMFKM